MSQSALTAEDYRYMSRAIRLASHGLFTTHPNPRVGCVLVKQGQIIGEGWHERAGEGHAEVQALERAGDQAKGATAYVSLEPCSHFGRTPPCAEALIKAGVGRVVAAVEDPNPLVAGRGIARLRSQGVDVHCGVLAEEAEALNPGFFKRMRLGLPWVWCKSAASLDGRTAASDGSSQWITGNAARQDVQHWRARCEAIITGVGTILADDPAFTIRPEQWADHSWPDGFAPIQPLRVILDSQLRTPPQARILQQPGATWICCVQADPEKRAQLESKGARVLALPESRSGVDLQALLRELAEHQVNEVLVEAGSGVTGSFLAEGLVDEWILFQAMSVLGCQGQPVARLPGLRTLGDRLQWQCIDVRHFGADLRLRLRPRTGVREQELH
jgi:diaminohydroxyphosphoribosylaminopyrimidine deaminase/5-amino-6-(5-phosphoribosylamino)uracil reductase